MVRRSARDPYVARALALLHHDIARRWTVDDLCREVGLSRSALADRFIRLIGVPPMHYLASWRMQVATQQLPQHQCLPRAACRDRRLRFRGRILPLVQEGIRHGASHLATFEQVARIELGSSIAVPVTVPWRQRACPNWPRALIRHHFSPILLKDPKAGV